MNNKIIIGIVAAIVIIGGVVLYVSSSDKSAMQDSMTSGDAMMKEDKLNENEAMMEKDKMESDAMMKDDKMESDKMEGDAMMQKSGSYKDYSTSVVAAEQSAGNKVVLFFHAPWCPFCKTADAEFKAKSSEIPAGVTVLKIDYDSNLELRKKYALTYQHTFVQIDNSGNLVTKWSGGGVAEVKTNVK